ncbi:MAG: acetyl-CoA carboxylase biotin carboxylase subunit [Marinilabiliales bacterium]|nr:MAG: acetyl-CoA carboxylase biotin carboxylase subunit [Marinilabiliales bacterium]
MIRKILIANRGEIAVRIIRSCREMGIKTVAVFSDADRKALHVRYADEAVHIGPSPSAESYLVKEKIIEAAKRAGADAIHPGYGFLSENAGFAEMVRNEGIIFIGPQAESIRLMGDKISARSIMTQAGVPVVPGTKGRVSSDKEALDMIAGIGFPLMIKASAGGGGKGMRLVYEEKDFLGALGAARSESMASFGDDSVYIEKYITSPHHIEFQVLADSHGNVIHLCERECSIQRRHQKIVEETPSPIMTPELRREMGEKAIAAAHSVSYEGAGTIEFLVDENLNYYFLEMNTRLQVEHPITERVTGVDLVKEQIRIASGEKLAYSQDDIFQDGHAIECRIYAEDPENNFMPSPGLIRKITEPMGFGVRTDGYVYEGYEIPIYYDPMISKLITWGKTRDEAITRMSRSLDEYYIMGIRTSIDFLKRIMEIPEFIRGEYDTHFIEKHYDELFECPESLPVFEDLAMIVAYMEYLEKAKIRTNGTPTQPVSNWKIQNRSKNMARR